MLREECVTITLTRTEAWDLLSRCLNSAEADTTESKEAMRKLADALRDQNSAPPLRLAG